MPRVHGRELSRSQQNDPVASQDASDSEPHHEHPLAGRKVTGQQHTTSAASGVTEQPSASDMHP
jgi:hypothetical protein